MNLVYARKIWADRTNIAQRMMVGEGRAIVPINVFDEGLIDQMAGIKDAIEGAR